MRKVNGQSSLSVHQLVRMSNFIPIFGNQSDEERTMEHTHHSTCDQQRRGYQRNRLPDPRQLEGLV